MAGAKAERATRKSMNLVGFKILDRSSGWHLSVFRRVVYEIPQPDKQLKQSLTVEKRHHNRKNEKY